MKMQDRFDWNPGASAPKCYPMEYVRNSFYYADGGGCGAPGTAVGWCGDHWGENAAGAAVGEVLKPIPVRLKVTWLSYTENKFYEGDFALPYDTILALFKMGWPDFNYYFDPPKPIISTFNEITTGMAPGGIVVVWLVGAGHQVEVARFQAKEISMSMKEFMRRDDYGYSQTEYTKFCLKDSALAANLKEHGIPYGLWDKYRQKFSFKPTLKYDQREEITTERIYMNFYNAETEAYDAVNIYKDVFEPRARIKQLSFGWFVNWANKNQGYQLLLDMNEPEMMQAYETIYGKDGSGQGELLVEINRGNDVYKMYLQGNGKKVQIMKAEGEIMLTN